MDQNRHQIVHCGGAASLVQAIKEHPSREDVVEQACKTLYMVAFHQDLRPSVLAADGSVAAAAAVACSASAGGRAQKWGRWLQEVLAC